MTAPPPHRRILPIQNPFSPFTRGNGFGMSWGESSGPGGADGVGGATWASARAANRKKGRDAIAVTLSQTVAAVDSVGKRQGLGSRGGTEARRHGGAETRRTRRTRRDLPKVPGACLTPPPPAPIGEGGYLLGARH